MYIDLKLPAGIYANGTDLQAGGRWRDASLVRWRQGAMMPVGGWRERFGSLTGATPAGTPRGMISWVDNSYDRHIAFGTFSGLYEVNTSGVVDDLTPAGFSSGIDTSTESVGFGTGAYGASTYGTPRADTGVYADATSWALDTWGEYLIACSSSDGKIYEWDLAAATAAAVTNAPTGCASIIVTDERFLMALGPGGEPNRVEWSDRENNTVWTAASTNEAGGFTLKTNGRLQQGVRVRGQTLLLTDVDAWTATYTGSTFVYGFDRVGTNCGAISKMAAAAFPGGAMWLSRSGFHQFAGGVVEPVACDVLDEFLSGISTTYTSQIHAVPNAAFNEIWWFYPSEGATECDSYVAYNYLEGHWMVGSLTRTAGIDSGVFSYPIWMADDLTIYDHEVGALASDGLAWAETGPIVINNNVATVTEMLPDEEVQGECTVTLKARYHPNGSEHDTGELTLANPTTFRITGRQFRLRLDGVANKDFRWGDQRLNVEARGRR